MNIRLEKLGTTYGFMAIFIWCVISALGYVLTSNIEQSLNIYFLCFGTFFFSWVFFTCVNYKKNYHLTVKVKNNFLNVACINLATFGCWLSTIYPLKYIEPSIVNTLIIGFLPLATMSMGRLLHKNSSKTHLYEWLISLLLLGGIILLSLNCIRDKFFFKGYDLKIILISLTSCLCAGITLAINNIYTKKLISVGFSILDILSVRFILIASVMGILSVSMVKDFIDMSKIMSILLTATSLIILPQIFLQYSLKKLDPMTISIAAPLMPVMIYIIEINNKTNNLSKLTLIALLLICISSMTGSVIKYKKQKK